MVLTAVGFLALLAASSLTATVDAAGKFVVVDGDKYYLDTDLRECYRVSSACGAQLHCDLDDEGDGGASFGLRLNHHSAPRPKSVPKKTARKREKKRPPQLCTTRANP